ALVAPVEAEAKEEGTPFDQAAQEALKDSAIAGCQIEVWSRGKMIYQRPEGDPLGPATAAPGVFRRGRALLEAHAFPDGTVLLAGATDAAESQVVRVFAWSLLLSLPVSLLLAAGIGGLVGRRATRPLVDFTRRVKSLRDLEPQSSERTEGRARVRAEEPAEVADLDEAFHRLLERLSRTLAREIEFAANASHELRTPLTNMRLYAEEAAREATGKGLSALEQQIREIDRMVRLVDSLLVMARESESGLPRGEAVNLADLAREVTARVLGDGASGSFPDEALVRGDESLLGIAIENLVDNARKFTPAGSTVGVALGISASTARLSVTSPGVRIGDGERERLFERFFRSAPERAAHAGHGLGLALARHIARLHGGDVTCASSAGEDARFVLEIPAWRP
ncbi:MAG: HAMP domain-containing histidine kinase, partial [Acidobacteria bacterium]|nr:HAMP domain-containing histidine kinase [Acidobacteriota bacterium]